MKFATNQPAPRGNLVVHCGGHGSLSSCIYKMGGVDYIGQDNSGMSILLYTLTLQIVNHFPYLHLLHFEDNYNVIAFDR